MLGGHRCTENRSSWTWVSSAVALFVWDIRLQDLPPAGFIHINHPIPYSGKSQETSSNQMANQPISQSDKLRLEWTIWERRPVSRTQELLYKLKCNLLGFYKNVQ